MKNFPKSPQEIAAQALDTHPFFDSPDLSAAEAAILKMEARDLRAEVEAPPPYLRPDDELRMTLDGVHKQARESGIMRVDQGAGAVDRIAYATERKMRHGFTEPEAAIAGIRALKANGYLTALRHMRRSQEQVFRGPIDKYNTEHPLDAAEEKAEVDRLRARTIDLRGPSEKGLAQVSQDFPGGNFLFHSAGTEQLVKIIDSGVLTNSKALQDKEKAAAAAEGREVGVIRHNSGFEGISWSWNGVDALPGDRYHMAGFVAAPETVLGADQQLAIPSRPAPEEVIQLSAEVDANKFYNAKTQLELLRQLEMGEANSVVGNLAAIRLWENPDNQRFSSEPLLYQADRTLLAQPDYQDTLRELYSVDANGTIRLAPELLQQVENDIPVAAVWIQAAIDTGRLQGTQFEGKDVRSIINELNGKNITELIAAAAPDIAEAEAKIGTVETISNVEVPIEKMYFVAPRKDAQVWLKLLARSPHKPAGIILYDDIKVRLENFAGNHRGNHLELTRELQKAINPHNPDHIDYSQVLGTEFSDDMRSGHRHQVIGEGYLTKRRIIKNVADRLVVQN